VDTSLPDFDPYKGRLDILRQVADQVIRDFEMFGAEIQFSGNPLTAYAELFEQLLPFLEGLQLSNQQKLISILYRVDLSENQVKKALLEEPEKPFAQVLTKLFLKRELQKVVMRNQFKNGQG
jgi:hypothetical protein